MNIVNAFKTLIMHVIIGVSHTLVIIGSSLVFDNFILGNWINAITSKIIVIDELFFIASNK